MADEKSKESEPTQEFKLEQDTELRFEVEGKEKATVEVGFAAASACRTSDLPFFGVFS